MNTPVMRLIVIALTAAALTSITISAQVTGERNQYSHRELKKRMREAYTAADFKALAVYFRSQESAFKEKAATEKKEWDRRRAVATGPAAKPPTPADSARNLYQYYVYESDQMAMRAAYYEHRAQQQQPPGMAE